jgi:DHA1 family tetracycline resistance protein-like MFS transporter
VAPAAQRSRLFGYVYLSASLAYVIGPLAGGKLADRHLVSWFGYATPFWATVALLLSILVLTAARFRETATPSRSAPVRWMRALTSVRAAAAPGPLRRTYATNFVLYLAIFGFFRVYPMYLIDHFHMTVGRESLFVAWVAVPIVAANLGIVSWLSCHLTPRRTAAAAALVLGVAMAAIVIPRGQDALWITLGITGLAAAICLPIAATIISQSVSAEAQGSALGSNQSLQVGAEAITGLAGGLLAALATALPLSVTAALAVVAAGLFSRLPETSPPQERPSSAEPGPW